MVELSLVVEFKHLLVMAIHKKKVFKTGHNVFALILYTHNDIPLQLEVLGEL